MNKTIMIMMLFSTFFVQANEPLPTVKKADVQTIVEKVPVVKEPIDTTTKEAVLEITPSVGKHVGGSMDAMSMIVSLLMVLALIVITAFVLKRIQPARFDNKHLKIVTRLQLGTKESLVVVQVGEKQQLLGVTSGQITLLDTLDDPIKQQNSQINAGDVGQSLVKFFQKQKVKNS